MSNICWGFYGGQSDSISDFVMSVNKYNEYLGGQWEPYKIVINCKQVTI